MARFTTSSTWPWQVPSTKGAGGRPRGSWTLGEELCAQVGSQAEWNQKFPWGGEESEVPLGLQPGVVKRRFQRMSPGVSGGSDSRLVSTLPL